MATLPKRPGNNNSAEPVTLDGSVTLHPDREPWPGLERQLEGAAGRRNPRLVEAKDVPQPRHPDKKVYELTASGRERVQQWLADVTWSKVAPLEFHLKLVVAAATRLADPVALVDSQRLELLRELRQLQELALAEPPDSDGALLLEGASLRLQADIRWLEVCERRWAGRESR